MWVYIHMVEHVIIYSAHSDDKDEVLGFAVDAAVLAGEPRWTATHSLENYGKCCVGEAVFYLTKPEQVGG